MTVIDYVQYEGSVYLCKTSHTASSNPTVSSNWIKASKMEVLTVNNLLANHAKLGSFNFSGNVFSTTNGALSMNSSTGEFKCTKATVTGTINATSGSIGGFTITSGSIFGGSTNKMHLYTSLSGSTGSVSNTGAGIRWMNSNSQNLLTLATGTNTGSIFLGDTSGNYVYLIMDTYGLCISTNKLLDATNLTTTYSGRFRVRKQTINGVESKYLVLV